VIGIFLICSAATAIYAYRMRDVYSSDTLILVDPQRVPESYVRATVTGDIRNRLSTLSEQILSATRLQKIIDSLNLYPSERKTMPREDVIGLMRANISVKVMSDFGAGQDLQAFRIGYRGAEPRLVAQVANELASLFIDENLKAREEQATGTTEFLQNQLEETRKSLEQQEAKLKDFKLKHLGEMPEQQSADLQILGQLQSQLQLEGEALARAEQQRNMVQTMLAQPPAPVVDLDGDAQPRPAAQETPQQAAVKPAISAAKVELAALLARGYTNLHPAVKKLRAQVEKEDAVSKETPPVPVSAATAVEPISPAAPAAPQPAPIVLKTGNPVLQSQLKQLDAEIDKHKQELQRLNKQITGFQSRLEAIPVREQQVIELVRDYEMSKAHYGQLLDKQLSAETATQLEIRQKGEKFSILDPAQPAEKPSSPNRAMIDATGSLAGLGLGILIALISEFLGTSITIPQQITESTGIPVLEVIPVIKTYADRSTQRRRIVFATVSGALVAALATCVAVFYHYRS
jgi:polysaccharide chain length determinant protein (PEP-CTERM system associated)